MIRALTGKAALCTTLCTARLNIWEGSVRSGKTVSSVLAWLAFVLKGPPGPLLMVGKTERTLRRNIIDPMVEWLGASRVRMVAGAGELHICGRKVYLAGANDERSQEKIRGMTLVGAYVDEATLVPESFWSMLLSRLSMDGARLYATTNPDSPAHWLLRDYLSRPSLWVRHGGQVERDSGPDVLDLARFSFRLADNPSLSAAYVDALSREYVGLWRRRYIGGEWVVAEGSIWEAWDPDRHLVADLPDITRWYGTGVDHGTVNPFAALTLGHGADGRLYLAREYRHDSRRARRQMTDPEYSAALIEHRALVATIPAVRAAPPWTYVDPSAAGFLLQCYRDGIPTAAAVNDVGLGLRLVAGLFAQDRLRVHESCTGLIEEIPAYVWDPDKQAKGEDAPIKLNDHSCDASRYVVTSTEHQWRHGLIPVAT